MSGFANKLAPYMIALSTVFSFTACEKEESPEPLNPRRYNVTEMTISFNQYDEPSSIQFRAGKPDSDCSNDASYFDYSMSFDNNQFRSDAAAFVKADFDEIKARNNYGDFIVDGVMSVEANSIYSSENLGVSECGVKIDYFELYLDNALVITNTGNKYEGKTALENFDMSGENLVSYSRPTYTSGDFNPAYR